jgi:hypothetical protein
MALMKIRYIYEKKKLKKCFLHLTQMHPILVSLTPIWSAALRFRRKINNANFHHN